MTKKIIVAGTRDVTNKQGVFDAMDMVNGFYHGDIEIVSGLARGPDTFGKLWAEKNNKKCHEFPASWDKYGKRAGYLRNEQMAEFSDVLVAFWDGKSKGTDHMINLAKKHGLKVVIIKV